MKRVKGEKKRENENDQKAIVVSGLPTGYSSVKRILRAQTFLQEQINFESNFYLFFFLFIFLYTVSYFYTV